MYADGTPGTKPYVPLETSIRAKSSLFSVNEARMSPRSCSEHGQPRNGSSGCDQGRRSPPRCQDAAHGWTGTVRGRLLPRRTTARRPRVGPLRRAPGAAAGRIPHRRADPPGGSRARRGRDGLARAGARGGRARPARAAHALDRAGSRPPDRRRPRCARARGGAAAARARCRGRRSSAAAAGTPISASPRPAPSSATSTAPRPPTGPHVPRRRARLGSRSAGARAHRAAVGPPPARRSPRPTRSACSPARC